MSLPNIQHCFSWRMCKDWSLSTLSSKYSFIFHFTLANDLPSQPDWPSFYSPGVVEFQETIIKMWYRLFTQIDNQTAAIQILDKIVVRGIAFQAWIILEGCSEESQTIGPDEFNQARQVNESCQTKSSMDPPSLGVGQTAPPQKTKLLHKLKNKNNNNKKSQKQRGSKRNIGKSVAWKRVQ